jgi:hypothetical protein
MISRKKLKANNAKLLASSIVLTLVTIFLTNCGRDESVLLVPTITGFSPASGPVGTTVFITGDNFVNTLTDNLVTFGEIEAAITSASTTSLAVTVPGGATTGKIRVTIKSRGVGYTSATDFLVTASPPVIASFAPVSTSPGHRLTITGVNFSTIPSENVVSFNNTAQALASSSTPTTLNVIVPTGATSGKLKVTVNGASVVSTADFKILEPAITSFTPQHGLPGETVTINGSNFGAVSADNVVKFNGTTATITSASDTQIIATVPSLASTGAVTITFAGRTATSNDAYEVLRDIPRVGLIAFYPFTGNANNASGISNLNGTPVDGPTLTTDRFGSTEQCYSFDGINDYIDMGNPVALQIIDKITIGVWVKKAAFTNNAVVLSKTQTTTGSEGHGYSMALNFSAGGEYYYMGIRFQSGAPVGINLGSGAPFIAGEWEFLVFTLDGQKMIWYKDGVETSSSTANQPLTASSLGNFVVGKNSESAFYFNGIIDDVTIYNRVLPVSEIIQLYEQTVSKY